MNIVLVDLHHGMIQAWREVCQDLENVSVVAGSIFEVECDALVSPANSFGFMDGGLDMRISQFFGWHVQERVQQIIQTKHRGELLVGQAEVVATDHAKIPYVISAPTMRVPMILGAKTINIYLATRAILLLIKFGEVEGQPLREIINTVAIPGMGTGVGRVPFEICARQMRTAIEEVVLENYEFPASWVDAQTRHQMLYDSETRDLQYPDL